VRPLRQRAASKGVSTTLPNRANTAEGGIRMFKGLGISMAIIIGGMIALPAAMVAAL
jgi:hypothetical protein